MSKAAATTFEEGGVRVAVEGCGHGTLDAIYAAVTRASKARGWDGVDLLIIGGDFQAARNAADLSVMSVPDKYRHMGDFHAYYSGKKKAPYLTIFIAGNHEASAHLWELYYGGWVAPNIYYLGAANVIRFGPLRIAAMSGIWQGLDYRKPHHERLPFNHRDIKTFYHVREIDVRRLLLVKEQVDIGLSHDWPRGIEYHGDTAALMKMKPHFRQESRDGTLGNPAATYVMDRLRPAYWFSAHMHCKFSAIKTYDPPGPEPAATETITKEPSTLIPEPEKAAANPDEIDLDDEDDAGPAENSKHSAEEPSPTAQQRPSSPGVPDDLRGQLPASFTMSAQKGPRLDPGQPVPPTITNTTTRFLSLDKCLPGRQFIQLCELSPLDPTRQALVSPSPPSSPSSPSSPSGKQQRRRFELHYDPEWLAITRALAPCLAVGDPAAGVPPDRGEAAYAPLVAAARAWVDERLVRPGRLAVPRDFAPTAPPHRPGLPERVPHQPDEHTNPQTAAFCHLLGVPNLWDATPEERAERKANVPPPPPSFSSGGGGGGGGGGWRGGGRGGRGGGRGRGSNHGRGGGGRGGRGGRH